MGESACQQVVASPVADPRLAGGGGGTVQGGRHLVYGKDTPLMNLYLSLFDRMGCPTERFGDSTGRLKI